MSLLEYLKNKFLFLLINFVLFVIVCGIMNLINNRKSYYLSFHIYSICCTVRSGLQFSTKNRVRS
ncbi:hypothetical protein FKV91_08485 [Clostridium acetobutylicum]|nr:hypothetical protein DK921_12610 [Clostridium acetobutylicum]PSM05514.1 hypothetical protein C7T89_12610 [Clostridium sp. NJ4]TQD48542.1 hypothetical protein FKV91_08485 [Clostridium acetobutylicum]